MATQAYRTWVAAGRPWQLARPLREFTTLAKSRGVPILGTIGNDDHLLADFPEDHTPFSFSAYPTPLPGANRQPGYWVCAADLADQRGWGAALLRDARAGALPWLKYMNWAGRHYAWSDSFRQGFVNSDQHIHLSCFSDDLDTSIGNYDPEAVIVSQPISLTTQVVTYRNGKKSIENVILDSYDKIFNEIPAHSRELAETKSMVATIRQVVEALPELDAERIAARVVEILRPELAAIMRAELGRLHFVVEAE